MAKKEARNQINLLPQEEFDASTMGRVLKWLLGTFRYIVIGTEMIVMVAFLSRFWLDSRSNDLVDAINQKRAVIASYSTFEGQFRTTQKNLKIYKDFTASNNFLNPVVANIAASVPQNTILTEITITGTKISIQAQAVDGTSASGFINNLISANYLQNVSLASVDTKQGGQIVEFTVNANVKERGLNAQ